MDDHLAEMWRDRTCALFVRSGEHWNSSLQWFPEDLVWSFAVAASCAGSVDGTADDPPFAVACRTLARRLRAIAAEIESVPAGVSGLNEKGTRG